MIPPFFFETILPHPHRMFFRHAIATALILTATIGASAQQTRILTAERHNEYGLVYSLPRTALSITFTAVKETRTPGPFYQYARKYIGTDKVVTEATAGWTVKEVEVEPYGVPDTETSYLMQLKSGSQTFMAVAPDGMLLAINADPGDDTEIPARTSSSVTEGDEGGVNDYLQYVGEDFVGSQSSAKQAEMLAQSLMEVRDAYLSLTRGTADNMPSDGRQLELMLSSLNDQESALMRAFTGTVKRETVTRTFTYLPTKGGREVLFRLSDFAGFVESDNYAGAPVYIDVEVTRPGELPVDADGKRKTLPKDAVIYALPGTAGITISYEGRTLWSADMEFAQFGTTFGLAPSLFTDRKSPSYAIFDPATGAVREIGVKSQTEGE